MRIGFEFKSSSPFVHQVRWGVFRLCFQEQWFGIPDLRPGKHTGMDWRHGDKFGEYNIINNSVSLMGATTDFFACVQSTFNHFLTLKCQNLWCFCANVVMLCEVPNWVLSRLFVPYIGSPSFSGGVWILQYIYIYMYIYIYIYGYIYIYIYYFLFQCNLSSPIPIFWPLKRRWLCWNSAHFRCWRGQMFESLKCSSHIAWPSHRLQPCHQGESPARAKRSSSRQKAQNVWNCQWFLDVYIEIAMLGVLG